MKSLSYFIRKRYANSKIVIGFIDLLIVVVNAMTCCKNVPIIQHSGATYSNVLSVVNFNICLDKN